MRRPECVAGALLAAAAVGAWHHTFAVPFLFDDASSITENPTIKRLTPLSVPLTPPAGGYTVSGRPLLNLSLALNWAISGPDVWSYHVVNLLIHIGGGLTLFGIVRRTLQQPRLRDRFAAAATPLAALTAAGWLLHPLQTESVTYIIQRAEALVGLFYLLTLYCFIRGVTPSAPLASAAPVRQRWLVLAVVACLCGMASKEVMVSAPLLVLLYDRAFVSGSWSNAWRRHRGLHLALASTWILLGWLMATTGSDRGGTVGFGLGISWWTSLLTQCEAIGGYLRRTLWPGGLIFDYGTGVVTSLAVVWPQAALLLALAAATAWAVGRNHPLGVAGVWFFAILAPSSSVIPVATQTIAEHRMYLPLAGVIVPAAIGLYAWLGRRSLGVLAGIALALGVTTYWRNLDFQTRLSIFTDTVAKRPDNPRARNDLGNALYLDGRAAEAIAQYEEVLRRKSDYPKAHYNLGRVLLEQERRADALNHLERALQIDPHYALAHQLLGRALLEDGRPAEALPHLVTAIATRGEDASAHLDLARGLDALRRPEEAEPHYAAARRLDPGLPDALNNEGNTLARRGETPQAADRYRVALRLDPLHATARINLANILIDLGQTAAAIMEYETALAQTPDDADAHNNLGRVLAQAGRIAEALPHFAAAVRLRPADGGMHLNFGQALLLTGDIARAKMEFAAALRADPSLTAAREMLEELEAAR